MVHFIIRARMNNATRNRRDSVPLSKLNSNKAVSVFNKLKRFLACDCQFSNHVRVCWQVKLEKGWQRLEYQDFLRLYGIPFNEIGHEEG